MATPVEELLNMLFDMVDEARNAPLSSEKCVIERDKALDLIEDAKAQLPVELAEARKVLNNRNELLSSAKLTLNTQIQSVDSAEANQHGKVALQSPVAGTQVIEGTAVTLSVYRVASLVHAAQVDITLPESDASMDVRITLVDDEGIETEVYADTLAADSPRNTTVTIESTLTGSHVCRVYLDGSFAYQRTVTLE